MSSSPFSLAACKISRSYHRGSVEAGNRNLFRWLCKYCTFIYLSVKLGHQERRGYEVRVKCVIVVTVTQIQKLFTVSGAPLTIFLAWRANIHIRQVLKFFIFAFSNFNLIINRFTFFFCNIYTFMIFKVY